MATVLALYLPDIDSWHRSWNRRFAHGEACPWAGCVRRAALRPLRFRSRSARRRAATAAGGWRERRRRRTAQGIRTAGPGPAPGRRGSPGHDQQGRGWARGRSRRRATTATATGMAGPGPGQLHPLEGRIRDRADHQGGRPRRAPWGPERRRSPPTGEAGCRATTDTTSPGRRPATAGRRRAAPVRLVAVHVEAGQAQGGGEHEGEGGVGGAGRGGPGPTGRRGWRGRHRRRRGRPGCPARPRRPSRSR